ncbi:SGNH/GDSL hydrolase family protein [Desulfovibrio litoralis]|uniref:SGNH hydrolase-type esterase domain-containing protein n=1 Tax=Desulfovibrio litoralis DSM 11393 TaxID=1121455 RepID=A0A1M7S0W1_9BACT|nr:SGNH/GDSL hydrolase family protein [Desulfovibrio litoralis]SHN52076.1 hypothetical protein SAMN02745728_00418 [Desulfovibrio litoralis DSM 11393]
MIKKGYIRAFFWLSKKKSVPVFPLRSIIGLCIVFICLVAIAFFLELELGMMAKTQQISTPEWVLENSKINKQNYIKILNNKTNPIMKGLGFAPPEVSNERKRILVVGDSYIWGDGLVNINTVWWRQLNWELEKRGYNNIDVIAIGVNGASTKDQLAWLKEKDKESGLSIFEKYKPDAIIFGYVTNDPDMGYVKQYSTNKRPSRSLLARLFPNIREAVIERYEKKLETTGKYNDLTGYPYEQWELMLLQGKNYEEYKKLILELSKELKNYNVPAFFVSTPTSPNATYVAPRYAQIKEDIPKAGIPFYNLLPTMIKEISPKENVLANPANGHPGPRVTRFFAKQVVDILEKDYPDVLGNRTITQTPITPKINDWLPPALDVKQTAKDEWTFQGIAPPDALLYMPIKEPHAVLSFERPRLIKELQFNDSRDLKYSVWVTALDKEKDFELAEYIFAGSAQGKEAKIIFSSDIQELRITSLRIKIDGLTTPPTTIIPTSSIKRDSGGVFVASLEELENIADSPEHPERSTLVMYENDTPLVFAHSKIEDIKTKNARYAHWQKNLYFSSSDFSDPRNNGKKYSYSLKKENPISLKITFSDQAVTQ